MRALFSIFAAFFGVMIIMVAATPINMDTSISINKQELVKRELNKRSLVYTHPSPLLLQVTLTVLIEDSSSLSSCRSRW